MQFPDRFCEDALQHRERWTAYLRHLVEAGFDLADPEYRPFVGEVFHDRPVRVSRDEGDEIELVLTHSHALNHVATELRRRGSKRRIHDEDFQVLVRLRGVVDRSFPGLQELVLPTYQQAELGKVGDLRRLEIEVRDDADVDRESVLVFVLYRVAEVEDIASAVRKYLGAEIDPDPARSPILSGPEGELAKG